MFMRTDEKIKILKKGVESKVSFTSKQVEKFIIFLGASGVGKTTTIMKLANKYPINYKIAIVTLGYVTLEDTHRLTLFCKKEKIKYLQLDSTIDLEQIQIKLKKFDVVLIDTVGMAPHEPILNFDIQMYTYLEKVSFSLVLPANLKYKDYKYISKCYKPLNIQNIILTKLDETKYLKSVVKFLNREKTPSLSYISSGKIEESHDNLDSSFLE